MGFLFFIYDIVWLEKRISVANLAKKSVWGFIHTPVTLYHYILKVLTASSNAKY